MSDPLAGSLFTSPYSNHRKKILAVLNQLRAIGAQTDLDLPHIAVIGNQSAGKSSVVEAISGINVPRDAGTCTRCPFECRLLSSTAPWQCQIAIRKEFRKNGERYDNVTETSFGPSLTNPKDVELALRRAQAAVLNPDVDQILFLSMSEDKLSQSQSENQLKFSGNTICLNISGPELTDLSFIDLPGIIQNAEPTEVKMVEDMVISHIQGNTLILVALPMTDDIENQKALRLAKMADPNGRRTIGVLTKPDMLSEGSTKALDLWVQVLEGYRHPLVHGYYVTRQPNDKERSEDITHPDARKKETEFFKNTSPWSRVDAKERLGTQNLVNTLSHLLVQLITEALPNIQREASDMLNLTTADLANLPPAPVEEPLTAVLQLVASLCKDVSLYVDGAPDTSELIHEHRKIFKQFKRDIRQTAPNFAPFVDSASAHNHFDSVLADEDVDDIGESNEGPMYLPDVRIHIERTITRELPGNIPFQSKKALIVKFQRDWPELAKKCFENIKTSLRTALARQVKHAFGRFDLLHNQTWMFMSELMSKHDIITWQIIVYALEVEQTPYTQNTHYLQESTDKWLSKYKNARAEKPIGMLDNFAGGPVLSPHKNKDSGSVASFGTPSVSSTGTFSFAPTTKTTKDRAASSSTGASSALSQASSNMSNGGSGGFTGFNLGPDWTTQPVVTMADVQTKSKDRKEKERQALASLAALGINVQLEDLGKLIKSDIYETELEVMAEVRGYFQIAYKRVIDSIPQYIDLLFIRAVAKELQPFLITKLGLGAEDATARCRSYLAEDPSIAKKRNELLGKKKRLETVREQLLLFGA